MLEVHRAVDLRGGEPLGDGRQSRIDHAAGAREAGLELADEDLLIFGHPRTGTPLMIASPSIAIDLPLKVLVWEDAKG